MQMSNLVVLNPRAVEKDFVAPIVFNKIVGSDIFSNLAIGGRTFAEDVDANYAPAAVKIA